MELSVHSGETCDFSSHMVVQETFTGSGWGSRSVAPPATCMMETVQPALDTMADLVRSRYKPAKHLHFPRAVQEQAVLLALVGKVLAQRVGAGFKGVWLECVIPHALENMHVSRVIGKIQLAVAEPPASELQDATNTLTSTLRIEAPESIPAPSKMPEIVPGKELAQSANTHHAPDQAASDEPNISRDSPDRVDEAQQQVLEDEGGVHCEEAQYVRDVASNQINELCTLFEDFNAAVQASGD